ncbi:MAG TPA: FAD:protein FMN transferase [Bryobacteraceae bacterium]|nr:FAD:protein FMN transferase [Bryobacteraceae bacterium]
MKTPWRATALSIAVVGALVALRFVSVAGRVDQSQTIRVQRPLMGTTWTIEVVDHGHADAARHAIDQAYAELARIDNLMSEWKPESPISQVNAAAGQHPVEVPEELRAIIERSNRYSEMSEGAFDITWHGMANIWHFDDQFVVPSQAAVDQARRHVNYRAIRIEGNRVFLPEAGMSIGLGGIAKGYAVDRASEVLARAGFHDSLVDGGGDIRVSGTHGGVPWQMGIQDPQQERGTLIGRVPVSGGAVVTSGDYERFRIVNGVRYHHIIDARTGWPATAACSVTVISPTAEQGVVLAKIVFIFGPERGLAMARAEGVDALLIDTAGKRYATDGFLRQFEER